MSEIIGIIVTILIGVAAKWIEDRSKKKKERPSSPSRYESSRPVAQESRPRPKPVVVEKVKPTFEEGQCAVAHDPEPEVPVAKEEDEALAAHYARWRQAIIDTQIITPKFKESL